MTRYEIRECVGSIQQYFYIWDNQYQHRVGEIHYQSFIEAHKMLDFLNKKHVETQLGA